MPSFLWASQTIVFLCSSGLKGESPQQGDRIGRSAQHLTRQPSSQRSCYLLNTHCLTRSVLSDLDCPVGSAALYEPSPFSNLNVGQ